MNVAPHRRTIVGALTTSLALLVHLVASLIVAPIILHRVGDSDYGLWVLLLSVIGYFGLLDLGIRSAVVRFTAAHDALSESESLARVTGAALISYSWIAVLALLATAVLAVFAPHLFHAAPGSTHVLRSIALILGIDAAISLPLGVFGGVLEGMQRFTFLNSVQIAVTIVRSIAFVVALDTGGRLVAIAAISVVVRLLAHCAIVSYALSMMPRAPRLAGADSATLFRIMRHSFATLCISVADRIRLQADAIVIGAFALPAAIADFALASRLSDLPGNFIQIVAQVVTPASSRLAALQERDRMRELVVRGNFVCALVILPASTLMALFAPQLLTLWVGAKYASAAPILVVLVAAKMLYFAQSAGQRALVGTGDHAGIARLLGFEALANLVLSVLLVRPFGILGVAIGTAIPMTVTSVILLPRWIARVVGIGFSTYLARVFAGPALLAVALAVVVRLAATRPLVGGQAFTFGMFVILALSGITLRALTRHHRLRLWAVGWYRR